MADDITLPTGEVVATDQNGTRHYQWGKLAVGPDGVFVALEGGAGANAGALRVTTAGDDIRLVDVTMSLDTSAYASGDLLADTQAVTNAMKGADCLGTLHSIMVIDEDDQGAAFTIYIANGSGSFGTENSAPSITDGNARTMLGIVDVATGDYKDLGGVKVAFKSNIGMAVAPLAGGRDVYVAIVNGSGTPTFTASGLKLRLGFLG